MAGVSASRPGRSIGRARRSSEAQAPVQCVNTLTAASVDDYWNVRRKSAASEPEEKAAWIWSPLV